MGGVDSSISPPLAAPCSFDCTHAWSAGTTSAVDADDSGKLCGCAMASAGPRRNNFSAGKLSAGWTYWAARTLCRDTSTRTTRRSPSARHCAASPWSGMSLVQNWTRKGRSDLSSCTNSVGWLHIALRSCSSRRASAPKRSARRRSKLSSQRLSRLDLQAHSYLVPRIDCDVKTCEFLKKGSCLLR